MGGDSTFFRPAPAAVCLAAALLPASWWLSPDNNEVVKHSPPKTPVYTSEELRKFNGRQGGGDPTILLAVLGRVFNVTTGDEFYAPGKGYEMFAGRDCSRAFALTSTKAKWLDKDLDGLKEKRILHLNDTYWGTFVAKYPIVGKLSDPPYNATDYDKYAGPFDNVRPSGPGNTTTASVEPGGADIKGAKPQRQSRCPVTRAARAIGNAIKALIPLQLAGPSA